MTELLTYAISVNGLFVLTLLSLKLMGRVRLFLEYRHQLRLGYGLVLASLILPAMFLLAPVEPPFGPIVKVWSESGSTSSVLKSPDLVHMQVSHPVVSGAAPSSFPRWLIVCAVTVFGFWLFYRVSLLARELYGWRLRFQRMLLLRSCGRVRIWFDDHVMAPQSFYNGLCHVILPYSCLADGDKMKMAVLHELQHHRQRDTQFVYIIEMVRWVFGWNPMVRKIDQHLSELQELACDEALIRRGKVSPLQYGQCLFDFAETMLSAQMRPFGAIGMSGQTPRLKRRIQQMFESTRTTPKKLVPLIAAIGLFGLGSAAYAMRGAVADQLVTMAQAKQLAEKTSKTQNIDIVVDKEVLYWLNRAVRSEPSRRHVRESLQRMKSYQSMIESKLGSAGLPGELIAVPLVESGFRNDVESPMKAAGLWQFIPETARRCGLEVSDRQDERYNPGRLTEAAVCYYNKLIAVFDNWHLAISAYNIGEHRLMSAITKHGHRDVFRLAREGHLGQEGKAYLPKVMAAMILVENPELVQ